MATSSELSIPDIATIRPWLDPVVDQHGHDPRSTYVERYWLSVIGPTATWVLRRIADGFDAEPSGYRLDLHHTAAAMGLSWSKGVHSPFGRAIQRCVMFGLAHPHSDGLAVRRRLPNLAHRHLRRLPEDLQAAHAAWEQATVRIDVRELERRLVEAGVPPRAAAAASEVAVRAA